MGKCHADSPDEEVTPEFGRTEKKMSWQIRLRNYTDLEVTQFGVHPGRLF